MSEDIFERILSSLPVPYVLILLFLALALLLTVRFLTKKPEEVTTLLRHWWLFAIQITAAVLVCFVYYWWSHRPPPLPPNIRMRVLVCRFSGSEGRHDVSPALMADLKRLLDATGLSQIVELKLSVDSVPIAPADAFQLGKDKGAHAVVWGQFLSRQSGDALVYPSVTCRESGREVSGITDRPIPVKLTTPEMGPSPTMQLALAVLELLPVELASPGQAEFDPDGTKHRLETASSLAYRGPAVVRLTVFAGESLKPVPEVVPGQVVRFACFIRNNTDDLIQDSNFIIPIPSELKYLPGSLALNGQFQAFDKKTIKRTQGGTHLKYPNLTVGPNERALITFWAILL